MKTQSPLLQNSQLDQGITSGAQEESDRTFSSQSSEQQQVKLQVMKMSLMQQQKQKMQMLLRMGLQQKLEKYILDSQKSEQFSPFTIQPSRSMQTITPNPKKQFESKFPVFKMVKIVNDQILAPKKIELKFQEIQSKPKIKVRKYKIKRKVEEVPSPEASVREGNFFERGAKSNVDFVDNCHFLLLEKNLKHYQKYSSNDLCPLRLPKFDPNTDGYGSRLSPEINQKQPEPKPIQLLWKIKKSHSEKLIQKTRKRFEKDNRNIMEVTGKETRAIIKTKKKKREFWNLPPTSKKEIEIIDPLKVENRFASTLKFQSQIRPSTPNQVTDRHPQASPMAVAETPPQAPMLTDFSQKIEQVRMDEAQKQEQEVKIIQATKVKKLDFEFADYYSEHSHVCHTSERLAQEFQISRYGLIKKPMLQRSLHRMSSQLLSIPEIYPQRKTFAVADQPPKMFQSVVRVESGSLMVEKRHTEQYTLMKKQLELIKNLQDDHASITTHKQEISAPEITPLEITQQPSKVEVTDDIINLQIMTPRNKKKKQKILNKDIF